MPEGEDELLEGERSAFNALREAKRAKASELQIEGYKIAQHRTLCEMARRLPSTLEELSECWGFGGTGVRLNKYGDYFLDVLAPFEDELREVHAKAKVEAAAAAAAAAAAVTKRGS